MLEIIKSIWNLKWWEVLIIAAIDDIFLLVKTWFIWSPLIVLIIVILIFKLKKE